MLFQVVLKYFELLLEVLAVVTNLSGLVSTHFDSLGAKEDRSFGFRGEHG